MSKTIKLSAEVLEKLGQHETSISHWSTEHAILLLRAKNLLSTIDSLYMSRQKMIDEVLAAENIKTSDVTNVNIVPSGEIEVTLKDS